MAADKPNIVPILVDDLSDLQSDPFETNNLAAIPAARDVLAKERAELERLLKQPD